MRALLRVRLTAGNVIHVINSASEVTSLRRYTNLLLLLLLLLLFLLLLLLTLFRLFA